jgi:hypothetical protein
MNRFLFPNTLLFILVISPILLCLHLTYSFISSEVSATPRTIALTTEWASYTSASGISMIYPSSWLVKSVMPSSGLEEIILVSQDGKEWIYSSITRQTSAEYNQEALLDQPTGDTGYQALWPQAIRIGNFDWVVFVWGQLLDDKLDGSPFLVMQTYSAEHELKIRLGTDFPLNYQRQVEVSSLKDVATEQLSHIWHIASSVGIEP